MKGQRFFSARNIAFFGVLLALVIVLQLFASAIPMFGVTLNFALIPIVLAGIFFGMWGGGFMGLIAGLITFLTTAVAGRESSTVFLFEASPALLTLTCIGKTTVAGFVAGLLYGLIARKNTLVAAFVASITVAVLNTGLYLVGIVCMKDAAAEFLGTAATANAVFVAVFMLVWLNFVLEIAVNVVLAPAIHRIVLIVERQIMRRHAKKSAHQGQAEQEDALRSGEATAIQEQKQV